MKYAIPTSNLVIGMPAAPMAVTMKPLGGLHVLTPFTITICSHFVSAKYCLFSVASQTWTFISASQPVMSVRSISKSNAVDVYPL